MLEDASHPRVEYALAKLDGEYSVTLWLDETDHIARIVALGDGQYVVEVLIHGDLWTVTHARPEVDVAPLSAGAAAVRGTPVVRATQILGVMSAVRLAMQWIEVARLSRQWRYLRS